MSLFLITDNLDDVKITRMIWGKLYSNIFVETFECGLIFVATTGNRDISIYNKKSRNKKVYGIGTFFSESGFGQSVLENERIDEFDEVVSKGIYGHYQFIIGAHDKVRIVTDRIGVLNVFRINNNSCIRISSDPTLLAQLSDNKEFSLSGVCQFLLKEATIGTETIFAGVSRLKAEYEFIVDPDKGISEKKLYHKSFEKLTFSEYTKRIEKYFTLISKYEGIIGADISAGFDTRLVASCASKTVAKLKGITNKNKSDNGVDEATSPIIAKALGIPLTRLSNPTEDRNVQLTMIHGFQTGRDIIRSAAWIDRLEKKYSEVDLSLGGYGGETIRAKYNNNLSRLLFVENYYEAKKITTISIDNKKLSEYLVDLIDNSYGRMNENSKQDNNWLYTIDRMRIWGGSPITMALLVGDILHPFMDWHLINPVFLWNDNQLKSSSLQKKIMDQFVPGISKIPINANSVDELIDFTNKIKRRRRGTLTRILFALLIRIKNAVKRNLKTRSSSTNIEKLYEQHSRSELERFLKDIGAFTLSRLEDFDNVNYITRLITVKLIHDELKNADIQ